MTRPVNLFEVDHMPSIIFLILCFSLTSSFLLLIAFGRIPFGNEEVVNVPALGSKLCDSQGLVFNNYTMKNRVPYISCTDKTPEPKSVYDGVVTYTPPVKQYEKPIDPPDFIIRDTMFIVAVTMISGVLTVLMLPVNKV